MTGESQSNFSSVPNTNQNEVRQSWGWFLALGIGMVVVGTLAIVFSGLATVSAVIVLGAALLVSGVVQGVHAFFVRNWRGFFLQGLMAVLYLLVGMFVLANPIGAIVTLTLLLAVFFLFEGLVKLFLAFQIRPATNWGWILTSGLMSLVISAIIWSSWPGDAIWVIGLLLGINILFSGWATVMFTLGARGGSLGWNWGGNQRNVTPST